VEGLFVKFMPPHYLAGVLEQFTKRGIYGHFLQNSQRGKIVWVDTKSIRALGSTTDVKLLDLEDQDRVAAAVVHPARSGQDPTRRKEHCCSEVLRTSGILNVVRLIV